MSLIVSYQPEGHGEPLFIDISRSESYEEVINRRLARQAKRASGELVWVTLQPQRFAELVRNAGPGDLELRLQIERIVLPPTPADDRYGTRSPSTLEIPPAAQSIRGINLGRAGDLPDFDDTSIPHPTISPLTPQSVFNNILQHSHNPPPASSASHSVNDPRPTNASSLDNGIDAFLAGRYSEAQVQFQQASHQSHEVGNLGREADCLRYLGTTCRHLEDYVAARSHLAAAKAIFKSLGPKYLQEELRCDRHLARIEADTGNHQTALVTYQQLMRTTEQAGLVIQHAWCSYYLGHLLNRMKRYREALDILKDVVNTSRQIYHHEIEGFATEESGYAAECQGHPQLAIECYRIAFNIFKEHGQGKWIENESRVKKRIERLSRGFPALSPSVQSPSTEISSSSHALPNTQGTSSNRTSRKWSIGTRLLGRQGSN